MRKYMALIVNDDKHPDRRGKVEITEQRSPTVEKNEKNQQQMRDNDTDEAWTREVVGLGYYDVESEEMWDEKLVDVIDSKLDGIDDEYKEQAGVET